MTAHAWTGRRVERGRAGRKGIGDATRSGSIRQLGPGTLAFAGLYLGSAAFNALVTVPDARDVFLSFRDTAWLGPYRWLIDDVILAAPTASAAALAGFELAVGGALLAGGRARSAALVAATAFVLGLIPSLGWPYWTANVGLAALQLGLLRHVARR
jgi:hypothetical protein